MFDRIWKSWLSSLAGTRSAPKRGYRPQLETLEERRVPSANSSISGFAYVDPTGNGYAAGDVGQAGVTVRLYRETGHRESLVSSVRTGANGAFDFSHLAAGDYVVSESAPAGWVQTTPTTAFYDVSVTGAASSSVSGEVFANFKKPDTGVISHVTYTVTDPTLGTHTFNNLRGHTHQGDTVTVNFTVRGTSSVLVSLVVYDAPSAKFNASTAGQDVLVEDDSELLSSGAHSLTVILPDNFYRVDFALGASITTFGPAGSNIFYSAEGRLIGAASGGTQAFTPASLSGNVYKDLEKSGAYIPGDPILAGVSVTLSGVNDLGQTVDITVQTNASGDYSFTDLRPGTYTIALDTATLPSGDAKELSTTDGSLGGNLGTPGVFGSIVVLNGQNGITYDLPVISSGGGGLTAG